jgi:hypothetical protein
MDNTGTLLIKNNWEAYEYFIGDQMIPIADIQRATSVRIVSKADQVIEYVYSVAVRNTNEPYSDQGQMYSAKRTSLFITVQTDIGTTVDLDLFNLQKMFDIFLQIEADPVEKVNNWLKSLRVFQEKSLFKENGDYTMAELMVFRRLSGLTKEAFYGTLDDLLGGTK